MNSSSHSTDKNGRTGSFQSHRLGFFFRPDRAVACKSPSGHLISLNLPTPLPNQLGLVRGCRCVFPLLEKGGVDELVRL